MFLNTINVKCPYCDEVMKHTRMYSINSSLFSEKDYNRIMNNYEKECQKKCPSCLNDINLDLCVEVPEELSSWEKLKNKIKEIKIIRRKK